ncbi:ATP-dependent DNA helicase PIF1-like [Ruditapes philippinarum]|uniref:ATP-dependent DNA helicase PIF1-like n=1 Tax=Ruditapes philippinarum TaxID=129788 RepID=UPI00295B9629|nr:ATP-dependent DNA helicase PIF1-like [Ruditapes philippinarum]
MANLNKNQSSALDAVLSGHNVLITAGTGKSFLISEIVKTCENQGKIVALTCTTGIACSVYTDMTLKANTLHRWSGIEDAPHKLWLKVGAVILLRNLSNKLVNGIRGDVISISEDGPVVDFHSVGIQAPMKKIQFTVFSLRDNKDIAVREQLPLKLAFAITIHKAQGMTLDMVEVDCRGIFKPGHLGVAMSRARDFCGLRVTNFTQRACMPQPDIVKDFINQPSQTFSEDLSCCQETLR